MMMADLPAIFLQDIDVGRDQAVAGDHFITNYHGDAATYPNPSILAFDGRGGLQYALPTPQNTEAITD